VVECDYNVHKHGDITYRYDRASQDERTYFEQHHNFHERKRNWSKQLRHFNVLLATTTIVPTVYPKDAANGAQTP
jgi:hypothetical protein